MYQWEIQTKLWGDASVTIRHLLTHARCRPRNHRSPYTAPICHKVVLLLQITAMTTTPPPPIVMMMMVVLMDSHNKTNGLCLLFYVWLRLVWWVWILNETEEDVRDKSCFMVSSWWYSFFFVVFITFYGNDRQYFYGYTHSHAT